MPGTTRHAPPDSVGAEVRRLRERVGRSIRDVTDELGWSVSKLSRIETGQSSVSAHDLAKLLDVCDADPDDHSRIGALARQAPPRPKRLSHALPPTLERYVGLEEKAAVISSYSAIVVPALLQIPEYAAAIIQANPLTSGQIEKVRIENRMVRQAVLARQSRPELNIVIEESILRRRVGDASTMRRQMLRLIEASVRPATTIRVLPFTAGTNPGQTGQFAILDFDEDTPPHVFSDGITGGVLHSKPDDVELFRLCLKAISEIALDEQQSLRMFQDAATGWARAEP